MNAPLSILLSHIPSRKATSVGRGVSMFYSFLVVSMSGAKKNSKKGSPYRKSGDKFIGTVTANKVSKKRNSQPSIANYTQKQSKP